ncbi:potassium channel family protein [Natrononativus amylolyticus]|uniref:potassium channel family protein n=1 Tax=Natrononativus amylolyticus TaxID=2963434 RepID=UPI0020CF1D44|nr:potassium channel family protein [Natrononativus amylolyticus]
MSRVFLVLGAIVLLAAIVDILWTTLWVDGGSGPLSARLASRIWSGLRRLSRHRPRIRSLAGPVILTATLAMWIGLIWTGWTLLFAGGQNALLDTQTGEPASWVGRLYYVAYTMFTNGNGDYTPNGSTWELASSFTTATGMLFVTLGVSYVLSVLGAVSEKRAFANGVTGLGDRGEAFVRASWSRGDFEGIDLPLESLASQLDLLAEQHKSYPILHYYHSENGEQASAMAVPIFDEALTLYRHGVPDEHQPPAPLVEAARSSVDSYLDTLDGAFIDSADDVPPPPELERLREEGIPTAPAAAFEDDLEGLGERRRKLLGMIESDARHWPPLEEGE